MVGMLSVTTCIDAQPSVEVASGGMEFTRGHTEEGGFGCHDCHLLWELRPLELRTRCAQLGHLSVLGLLCFTLRLWDYQCGLLELRPTVSS